MNAYIDALLRYFSFSGRSSRSQYWMFQLVSTLLFIVAIELDILRGDGPHIGRYGFQYGLVTNCVALFHFIPQFTVMVRRLHDIGKSGWWWLIAVIPLIGALLLLYWMCKSSDPGTNDYGEDPHYAVPSEPEYVPPSGIARLPNISRSAPTASAQTNARPQPAGFGMRGRSAS